MRTFSLFALLLFISAFSTVQASPMGQTKLLNSADFFTVTFPYDDVLNQNADDMGSGTATRSALNVAIDQGLKIVLLRVTGQRSFLGSEAGLRFTARARAWLRTYDVTPRVVDGVQIGQNIVLRFSEQKIRAALKADAVAIWPLNGRSTTLVMGSLVQKGQLLKLDQNKMRYRLDIEFRDDAQQMMLPIELPTSSSGWIFPVDPVMTVSKIQETLIRTEHDYLLSFKLVVKDPTLNILTWYVYSDSGAVVSKGQLEGENGQVLLQDMLQQVMTAYVEIDSFQALNVNEFVLNVHNLFDSEQILAFETLFQAQDHMIRSLQLLSVQAGSAQFKVVYQGQRKKLLKWIRSWQIASLMHETEGSGQLDVKINIEYFSQPSGLALEQLTDAINIEQLETEQTNQGVQ